MATNARMTRILCEAARAGDLREIRKIIQLGADKDGVDGQVLHYLGPLNK
jgi:hypothetical protein